MEPTKIGLLIALCSIGIGLACSAGNNDDLESQSAAVTDDDSEIQAYIDSTYYSDSEIKYSFVTNSFHTVDCIDFYSRSVKTQIAHGKTVSSTMPPAPTAIEYAAAPQDARNDGRVEWRSRRERACAKVPRWYRSNAPTNISGHQSQRGLGRLQGIPRPASYGLKSGRKPARLLPSNDGWSRFRPYCGIPSDFDRWGANHHAGLSTNCLGLHGGT